MMATWQFLRELKDTVGVVGLHTRCEFSSVRSFPSPGQLKDTPLDSFQVPRDDTLPHGKRVRPVHS